MLNRWKQIRTGAVAALTAGLALTAVAAEPKGEPAAPAAGVQASVKAQPVPAPVIVRDARTGQLRSATAPEIQALAAEIDRMFERGASAEKAVKMPNGSTKYSISGNFASGTFARRNADGKIETGCFDEAGPAKQFMGLAGAPVAPATPGAEEK